MTPRLDGRAAIVTGGSRGLGRAIALALAAEGAAVAVAGRTEQVWDERLPGTIGETVADIEAAGGRAVAVRADLTDRDDIADWSTEARDVLGPITILINNAAFTAPGRPPVPGAPERAKAPAVKAGAGGGKPGWPGFVSTPLHAFRRHFEVAVFAAYELMQLVCPDMIEAGDGSDHQHHFGGVPAARRRTLSGPCRRGAARLRRIQGGARASHCVRGVRSGRPQHRGECAVTVEADYDARPVLLRHRIRLTPPPRTNSPGRQCSWRWWTPAWSPGARSVIVRCSTAASARSLSDMRFARLTCAPSITALRSPAG